MSYRLEQKGPVLRVTFAPRLLWPSWLLYGGVFLIVIGAAAAHLPAVWQTPIGVWLLALVFLIPFSFFATFRESLLATPDVLRLERGALWFSWTREYSIEDVRGLGAAVETPEETDPQDVLIMGRLPMAVRASTDGPVYRTLLGYGPRQLTFDVEGKEVWTGPGLTQSEAEEVASSLRVWVRGHQRTVDSMWS